MLYCATQGEQFSWIEIRKNDLIANIRTFRSILQPHTKLGCVLKSNAYGHGFVPCLEVMRSLVDIIFVINPLDAFFIREFEKLKNLAQKRVVVLGALSPTEVAECAVQNIEISAGDEHWDYYDYFGALKEKKALNPGFPKIKIHLHIDTGLGREGVRLSDMERKLKIFKENLEFLEIQAVMSHFSNVEDVTEQEYALVQIKNLNEGYQKVKELLSLSQNPEKHILQSAASMVMNSDQFDIARIGLSLFGYWPSRESRISAKLVTKGSLELKPSLTWKCKTQAVKQISRGSYIGYGCTYRCERDSTIALVPVGYFDGYPRILSGKAHVLVQGKRCKVLGRVMMNHFIIDVSEVSRQESPLDVVLLGQDEKECVSAEMLADWAGTINYEILACLGSHLKRVVVTE